MTNAINIGIDLAGMFALGRGTFFPLFTMLPPPGFLGLFGNK